MDLTRIKYIGLVVSEDGDQNQLRLWSRDFDSELILKQQKNQNQPLRMGDWIDFTMESEARIVTNYSRRLEPLLETQLNAKKTALLVKTELIFYQPDEPDVAESPKLGRVGNFTRFMAEQLVCYEAWVTRLDPLKKPCGNPKKPSHAELIANFNVKWAVVKGTIAKVVEVPPSKPEKTTSNNALTVTPEITHHRAVIITISERDNAFAWILETKENAFVQNGAAHGLKPGDWIEYPKDRIRPFLSGNGKEQRLRAVYDWRPIDNVFITQPHLKTMKMLISTTFTRPVGSPFLHDDRFGKIKMDRSIRPNFFDREIQCWLMKIKPDYQDDAQWLLVDQPKDEIEIHKNAPVKCSSNSPTVTDNRTEKEEFSHESIESVCIDNMTDPVIAVIVFAESNEKFAWNPTVGTIHIPGQLGRGYEPGDWIQCTLKASIGGNGAVAKCRHFAGQCKKMPEPPLATMQTGNTISVKVNVYIPTGLPYEPDVWIESTDLNAVQFRRTDLPLSVAGTRWDIWAHFNKNMGTTHSSTPWTFDGFAYEQPIIRLAAEGLNIQKINQLSLDDDGHRHYVGDRDRYASGTSHSTTVDSGIGDSKAIAPRHGRLQQSSYHPAPAMSIAPPGCSSDDCLKRLLENSHVVAVLKSSDLQLFADLCEHAAQKSC